MDLPHPEECFAGAFPAETPEAFLKGQVRAFAYFSGVPARISDNSKTAMAKMLGGGATAIDAGLLHIAELLSVRR